MRLLERTENGELSLTKDLIDNIPPYAILSHTWGGDDDEVVFEDFVKGSVLSSSAHSKAGYRKIQFCGEQASRDGLQHFWVDTCCINKPNNTELSEAIISMFRWYRNAAKCYVYLGDVSTNSRRWKPEFRKSRWFTRGWTLQELIAPSIVEFFSKEGELLCSKKSLEQQLHEITGVAIQALQGNSLSVFSVQERLSWAEFRETKREEDKAYSLLGMFNVQIGPLYGEGVESAFRRLREAIDKRSSSTHGEIHLDRLPYAVDAPFNAYQKQHEPTCLPDTRIDLLDDIYNWADGQDTPCIFWLNGLAGTGKSTIARTVATKYSETGLGASFFFSRGGGDVSHAGKFVTSIAVQFANNIPPLRRHILDTITKHPDITDRSLRDQWQQLILGPLSKLTGNGCLSRYVLVVDALDECEDENNVRTLLQLFAEARSLENTQLRLRLRIFLTSRPETPIRHGFYQIPQSQHQDFTLHNISPSIVDQDISIFLTYNLTLIGQENGLDARWPEEELVSCLIQRASGLFIWAATACRFIREGLFAEERLHIILEGSNSTATPEKHLDGIYMAVLRNSIERSNTQQRSYTEQESQTLRDLLRDALGAIVILFSTLSLGSLSNLLRIPKQRVDRTLKDLHSIIDIPQDQTHPLRLHHPSFRDFLLNKDRCKDPNFQVNNEQTHRKLAASCIQLMSSCLKEDVCRVGRPGALVADIQRSQIQQCLPPELQYACLYWIPHLQKSGAHLHDQVYQFLREHLLHWLEALGWMQKVSEGIHAIISLESMISAQDQPLLSEFIHDTKRFILFNRAAIELAPLQTYCSALIFTPTMSIVRKQYKDALRWIKISPRVQNTWNALLQTLDGHSSSVNAVAFSPDGKLLASASGDKTIKLWDAGSGAMRQTLEGHSDWVNAVAFSPDGKLLASASRDETIKLWDAGSGAMRQTLEGHSDWVNAVAFSPDGKLLTSASRDKTIKLWDAGSGALRDTSETDGTIYTLSFSNDGTFLQTDRGPIHPSILSDHAPVFRPNISRTAFLENQWVGRGRENILWLPSEYRPDKVAIHESTIAFGYDTGRVIVIKLT